MISKIICKGEFRNSCSEYKGNMRAVFKKNFRENKRTYEAIVRPYFLSIQDMKKAGQIQRRLFCFQYAAPLNYTFEMYDENLL